MNYLNKKFLLASASCYFVYKYIRYKPDHHHRHDISNNIVNYYRNKSHLFSRMSNLRASIENSYIRCKKLFKKFPSEYTFFSSPRILQAASASMLSHGGSNNFIADIVEKVIPAVVHIEIMGYLGQVSSGSGFFINKNGLILTNAHVVLSSQSNDVKIKLSDGNILRGKVCYVDESKDLACMKVIGGERSLWSPSGGAVSQSFPFLEIENYSNVRTGEWVIAVGSPLTLESSCTVGIVSHIGRTLNLRGKDQTSYIQTDAQITTGNSGGPLVNLDGKAVGMNTCSILGSHIAFAISCDTLADFVKKVNQLESGMSTYDTVTQEGGEKKLSIGVTLMTLTPDIIRRLSRDYMSNVPLGVLIVRTIPGGPASKGGLREGDVIIKINGKKVQNAQDVYKFVRDSHRSSINIIAMRQGRIVETNIVPVTSR